MKLILGSLSPLKKAVLSKVVSDYFLKEFDVIAVDCQSLVPDTPIGIEIKKGAYNRAMFCKRNYEADVYIGIEGGITRRYGHYYEETWSCIITKSGKKYFGYSSGISIPSFIFETMSNEHISYADVIHRLELDKGMKESDTWFIVSGGVLKRRLSLEEAVRNVLIHICN